MFDILEADIVVFQETKIQRKDLTDDMVLIPGWDCYFSLPRHKKGYSGVVIYTRQSVCCPIRAEEGITGVLCPPNSSTPFRDLPEEQQIGGYPTEGQISESVLDATTLDSEGRCVILEFPAFVLLGVYSPANRDESRDDFRLGFLDLLDARIRNLHVMGKRVFLTGDLNISREELDAANAEASMRKQGLTGLEYVSTPARRLFNQLLAGGKVFGERDSGRETPVMWDICRAFHPARKGMFTCWEQKVNARPANCGARIDYVLCSLAMKTWFTDSNIQEGLMGSDHCPVYATFKNQVMHQGDERFILDVMNPPGMFVKGVRQREYSMATDPLPMSGRLIPEFSGRRNIRDMFARKPSIPKSQSSGIVESNIQDALPVTETARPPATEPQKDLGGANAANRDEEEAPRTQAVAKDTPAVASNEQVALSSNKEATAREFTQPPAASDVGKKRSSTNGQGSRPLKRTKSNVVQSPAAPSKGQQSLTGFFKPKSVPTPAIESDLGRAADMSSIPTSPSENVSKIPSLLKTPQKNITPLSPPPKESRVRDDTVSLLEEQQTDATAQATQENSISFDGTTDIASTGMTTPTQSQGRSPLTPSKTMKVHDPIESKESWSKLFTKPIAPRCESHNEPCVTLLTKKPGINLGRSFWMCPRPLGPSGAKERNTQWRCQTFIWCSDWSPNSRAPL